MQVRRSRAITFTTSAVGIATFVLYAIAAVMLAAQHGILFILFLFRVQLRFQYQQIGNE